MDSQQIAQALEEIGTLLELKGDNPFKIRAYHNAARVLEGLSEDLATLVKEERLQELPGIGKDLAEKIRELFQKGRLEYLDELRASFPPGLTDLLGIPGLGPKKVKALYDKLGIHSVGELEYACKENRLLELAGFGAKTQENILRGIAYRKKHQGSYLYDIAFQAAQNILAQVGKLEGLLECELGGSLRRCKEIVHDIDLVASAQKGAEARIMKKFCGLAGVESVIGQGDTKSSVRLENGIQVDLRIVEAKQYPYALLHFTGSKEHNTLLRGIAKDKGLKLNEYGLFKGEKLLPCKSEAEIYKALGLEYIPPELREAYGEIAAAKAGEIPELLEASDLQGVFHVHSNWSDGSAEIESMAKAAQKLGFKYMGLSDHSQSAQYAGGLTPADLKKQHTEIDKLNAKFKGFKILKGIESDILADGSLDYPEAVLKNFDFVIASVHSSFKMDEERMTQRLIKALKNPHTTMLGHLSGRLLLAREGYALNYEKIFEAAARAGRIIEINANPHRLDLDWRLIKKARDMGVKFSINPDAHSPEGLKDTFYGVGIARKGWLRKQDVFNTQSLAAVEKSLEAS